jgi:hypothetical protein
MAREVEIFSLRPEEKFSPWHENSPVLWLLFRLPNFFLFFSMIDMR